MSISPAISMRLQPKSSTQTTTIGGLWWFGGDASIVWGWAREALGDLAGAAADYERALALAPPGWTHHVLVEKTLARVRARLELGH